MGPASYYNMVFSGLTISFMEDFGYYKGNYGMEELLVWGFDTKCDAFAGVCSTHPHSCQSGSRMCTMDAKSMGSCAVDRFVESCPMFKEEPFNDCMYSQNKEELLKNKSVVGVGNMRFGK